MRFALFSNGASGRSGFDPGSGGIILGVRGSNLTKFDEISSKFDEL